ncbi:MAG TPA: MBOAT family O-acyltransferase [Bacteroidia bacterium]|nr:MBOAT family O-acyltransferase [Bacteroidia bacterium]
MLFNSLDFFIFLPIVFVLYWFVFNKHYKLQNYLLLVASYFFYACWDYRFLFLLIFSTVLDYYTGLKIHDSPGRKGKRFWLWLSIGINLGFLGFFKYYNFFVTSFADLLGSMGLHTNVWTLNIILPVGISFYTFHGLSYVIDIYYDRIKPERNFASYSLFVSFFPLLVAGPIERATHLLPQIIKERLFNFQQATAGIRLVVWGLFKKVVVADNCGIIVDSVFNDPTAGPFHKIIGMIFFSFQIYGDFSGYTDIARGVAKFFGFELMLNFNLPYFSRSIAEFWRRWHISLSSWFRDYVYIPLGGSKKGKPKAIRNVFVIFLISGFWHGANWTFIVWGGIHALLFLPSFIVRTSKDTFHQPIVLPGRWFPSFKTVLQILVTFILVTIAWVFFRAETLTQAIDYLSFVKELDSPKLSAFEGELNTTAIISMFAIAFMVIFEYINICRPKGNFLDESSGRLFLLIVFILLQFAYFLKGDSASFIYFQF